MDKMDNRNRNMKDNKKDKRADMKDTNVKDTDMKRAENNRGGDGARDCK